jgi:hypothetical protein
VSADAAPDAALRRRLRDDPDAAARLTELRRAAYGRGGSDDGTLDALLAEEDRLVAEGRRILADESTEPSASEPAPAPTPTSARAPAPAPVPPRSRIRRLLRPGPVGAAAVAVCLVAGLGAASASGLLADDDSWRSQEPTSTPGPPSTPDPRIGMPVPRFTAEPPARMYEQLTDAETARRLQDQSDSSWESLRSLEPDFPRPEATLERVVEGAEWVRQQAACLQEAGVDVRVIGVDDDVRLSNHSAPSGIAYACQVRFPSRPQGALTEETLAYLHAYYVDFLLPCYASEGAAYEGDVPDLPRFIARDRAGDPWYPEASSNDGGIAFRCPQAPDAFR